ncbi:T9SS type A sorting domain-containing protein [Balneola sp. MJW-20]|uniref:T9SS type A sorting domain-containing protein n=1 Tax=Gracilimonas aurantiaca TaxID=3234185 RepID=UPI0034664D8D
MIKIPIKVLFLVLISAGSVSAQGIISFSSGTLEGDGIRLSFSAGEAVSGSFESDQISLFGGISGQDAVTATSNEPEETGELPVTFMLRQNYPNPFNPSTNISFDLPVASQVQIRIYNTIGASVAKIANSRMAAGSHSVVWDASYLPSGMYIYQLFANGSLIETKKMILIK